MQGRVPEQQSVLMAQKNINFRRTKIARAKAAVKKAPGCLEEKKPARSQKDSPKQVDLNALLDTLNFGFIG
jgi:hypothetical protein